jgi:preprotein translocase subunit YajC
MKYTLQDLEKHFSLKRHEGAMFFLMLSMLPPGGSVEVINGRLKKIDEETIKLIIDDETIERISEEFIEESISDYDKVFGHLPLS